MEAESSTCKHWAVPGPVRPCQCLPFNVSPREILPRPSYAAILVSLACGVLGRRSGPLPLSRSAATLIHPV